jgi:hypothetical protein
MADYRSILDADRGGCFRIAPTRSDDAVEQLYFPDTNVASSPAS